MRNTKALGALALLTNLALLSACSNSATPPSNGSPSAPVVAVDVSAEIDAAGSRVIFPSSRFRPTSADKDVIDSAFNAAMNKCIAENTSINWQYPDIRIVSSEVYDMFDEYGPWTEDMATRFAYVGPQTEADMIANGIVRDNAGDSPEPTQRSDLPDISDADFDLIQQTCSGIPEAAQFIYGKLEGSEPAAIAQLDPWDIETKIKKDKRGKAIFDDLKACYSENGIAFKESGSANPNPVWVSGANPDALNEEQIQLALKDVACKNEINMIPRIAELWAEFEAPIIEENAAELHAYREKIDETLTKAKEYLAENEHYLGTW